MSGTQHSTAFAGCIGEDEDGRKLEDGMNEVGALNRLLAEYLYVIAEIACGWVLLQVGVLTEYLKIPDAKTGSCAVMVMGSGRRGSERSLIADVSAAGRFSHVHFKERIEQQLLKRASIVYCAGYFLTTCPSVIIEAGKHTSAEGKVLAVNLSAPFILEYFAPVLDNVIYYTNFVFGNETEIQHFGSKRGWGQDISTNALKMASLPSASKGHPRVVVITQGKYATLVACAGVISAHPVENLPKSSIVDSTGAGDAFTGGFLAT